MTNTNENKILYKDLSYKLQGLFFDIRNDLGSGHKESIYQKALEKKLVETGIKFIKEPPIKIYSKKGEFLGLYRPDFLLEDKIIVELKAIEHISRQETARVYDYLRNSKYELAYLINFASPQLFIKQLIFTNDRKTRMITNFKRIATSIVSLFVAISSLFVGIRGVNAAEFFATASNYAPEIGEYVQVDLFLDTKNVEINALETAVVFPDDLLELADFSYGNSVINYWVEKPHQTDEHNKIFFSGITPGGFNEKDAYLISLIFKTKNTGRVEINFAQNKTLKNNGFGTEVFSSDKKLSFTIQTSLKGDDTENIYKNLDNIPPEEFELFIYEDNNLFPNKKVVIFDTLDKDSGVSRYEVLEEKTGRLLGWEFKIGRWTPASSPYILQDQKMHSNIYVKAIDRAGNERISSLIIVRPSRWYTNLNFWAIILSAIILLILSRRTYARFLRKNKN